MSARETIGTPPPFWLSAQSFSTRIRLKHESRMSAQRSGDRRGFGVGGALEFHDFRSYQPGDDLRHIDWNAAARTGEYIVRSREATVAPLLEVWLDSSSSMGIDNVKPLRALELAALLCLTGAASGFRVRFGFLGDADEKAVAEAQWLRALSRCRFDARLTSRNLSATRLERCGVRIVVSDFLFDGEAADAVALLSQHCHHLVLVELLSPADRAPTAFGATELTDCESGERLELEVDGRTVDDYLRRLSLHRAQWSSAALQRGATWHSVDSADTLPQMLASALHSLFVAP
jgi:uncharacterized protein (DUF58 family)